MVRVIPRLKRVKRRKRNIKMLTRMVLRGFSFARQIVQIS